MILVSLGTQDRSFHRLLEAIDKAIENGDITDKVIVQAGSTKYASKKMEIFDYLDQEEYDKLLDECDLLICHGGVGTIIGALKKGKKIIGAARLAEYNEHQNDHQVQILSEFEKEGYLLYLDNFDELGDKLKEIKDFNPKPFESNHGNFMKLIKSFIDEENPKGKVKRERRIGLFFGIIGLILLAIGINFAFLQRMKVAEAWVLGIVGALLYKIIIQWIFDIENNSQMIYVIIWGMGIVGIVLFMMFPSFFMFNSLLKIMGMYTIGLILYLISIKSE